MVKNIKALIVVAFIGLVFIFSQTSQVAALSVMELLGLEKKQAEPIADKKEVEAEKNTPDSTQKNSDWAKTAGSNDSEYEKIDLNYVSLLVANMNEQERTKVLNDPGLFKQVIENEANNASATSAAITNNVQQDRNVEFLMQRSAESILREAYLTRLIVSKLPNDFPSEEQISEYFESNKEQFVVPERIHVWQIFFKKSDNDNENGKLIKKAKNLITDIKKGKKDFSAIALSQSEHEQSRQLGGYMGLLKTSDLLPEMKEPLLNLKEGELSNAITSESGIHILKKGKIIESEKLEIEQVKPQIRQLLIKQANLQLRQAIFNQARKEYPQDISEKKIEEWRLRLKTNTQ